MTFVGTLGNTFLLTMVINVAGITGTGVVPTVATTQARSATATSTPPTPLLYTMVLNGVGINEIVSSGLGIAGPAAYPQPTP